MVSLYLYICLIITKICLSLLLSDIQLNVVVVVSWLFLLDLIT